MAGDGDEHWPHITMEASPTRPPSHAHQAHALPHATCDPITRTVQCQQSKHAVHPGAVGRTNKNSIRQGGSSHGYPISLLGQTRIVHILIVDACILHSGPLVESHRIKPPVSHSSVRSSVSSRSAVSFLLSFVLCSFCLKPVCSLSSRVAFCIYRASVRSNCCCSIVT